jgi:chromatin segregation and condensation protein Rec8/ScpA/Scc1 (kleisin family)
MSSLLPEQKAEKMECIGGCGQGEENPVEAEEEREEDDEGDEQQDLARQAQDRALERLPAQPRDIALPRRFFSITEKIDLLLTLTSSHSSVSLHHLFEQSTCRPEAIALFLAMLELLKNRRIDVVQDQLFGDITILSRPQENANGSDTSSTSIDDDISYGGGSVGS